MPKDLKERLLVIFRALYDFHSTLGKKGNIATRYRIASYQKIIKILEGWRGPPIKVAEDLEGVAGIGASTLEKIRVIERTGTHPFYEEVMQDPEYRALLDLQTVHGIGAIQARRLYERGIKSVAEYKRAIEAGREEATSHLRASLKYHRDLQSRIPRAEISQFIKTIQTKYGYNPIPSGSYRMGRTTSGDIDLILVIDSKPERTTLIDRMLEDKMLIHVYNRSEKKMNGLIRTRPRGKVRHFDLLFLDSSEQVPWYLLYFGSGVTFSKWIRQEAKRQGYKLNEKGLFDAKTGRRLPFHPTSEREIFEKLRIPWVEPHLRGSSSISSS